MKERKKQQREDSISDLRLRYILAVNKICMFIWDIAREMTISINSTFHS